MDNSLPLREEFVVRELAGPLHNRGSTGTDHIYTKEGNVNILITGGGGFIGRAVQKVLANEGHEVATYDRVDGMDILNRDDIIEAVAEVDTVIHLAGVLGTDELFDDPYTAVDVNITGTLNVLDACVEHGANYVGITMPQVFPSIYTATKIASTKLATAYHHTHGLGVCHVRAYNAFGPGQAHGQGHPRKIIPAFSVEAWSGKPLIIWGDGTQTVDLISTNELAQIFSSAIWVTDDSTIDGGTGHQWTVNEVAKYVIQVTQSRSRLTHLPMRRGEIPTKIGATGEGWYHLEEMPRFWISELDEAILSYKNHPLVG